MMTKILQLPKFRIHVPLQDLPALLDDQTPTIDVIIHVLRWSEKQAIFLMPFACCK
jgi:hypothetical protein